jgi:hypothetical protein
LKQKQKNEKPRARSGMSVFVLFISSCSRTAASSSLRRCQHSYFCTSKASKLSSTLQLALARPQRDVIICDFVPSKASKLSSTLQLALARPQRNVSICTFVPSKASKLSSTLQLALARPQRNVSICTLVPSKASKLSSTLQLALARPQRNVSICTFVPSKASKLSSTLQLALARCRVVLSALHQLLHYSTQFTCFTGTKVQTLTSRAAASSSPRCTSSCIIVLSLLALLVQKYKH